MQHNSNQTRPAPPMQPIPPQPHLPAQQDQGRAHVQAAAQPEAPTVATSEASVSGASGEALAQAGLFRSTMAEQVKQMLKPHYQKQEIGKDHFKLIVKKTVDKLVAAHGNEVENTASAVNGFMTDGRKAKIQKLVDGYVKVYSKAQELPKP